jgi:hypothetical protein
MGRRWYLSPVSLCLAFLTVTVAVPARAQAQLCFRGQPAPRCGGFAILELTTGTRLNQQANAFDPYGDKNSFYLSWAAGYLHNLGQQSAVGAAFEVTADDDGHRYGTVLRYRQWLSPTWSLDLAPGVLLGGRTSFTTLYFPSGTADIAINWGDRFALTFGLDQLRRDDGTRWESHAGVRFGSWLTPLAMLGLVALAGATYNQ